MRKISIISVVIGLLCASVQAKLPTPLASRGDTVFTGKLTVTVSCAPKATVFYTTDGTEPGLRSPFAPAGWKFIFDSTVTLKVRAFENKSSNAAQREFDSSDVVTLTYTKKLLPPRLYSFMTSFKDSCEISIRPPEAGVNVYYTLDGSAPSQASSLYNGVIVVKQTTTVRCMAVKPNRMQSDVYSRTYTKLP
jgi:hypothetical protein